MDEQFNIKHSDIIYIFNRLTQEEKEKFKGTSILVTGYAGSLGYTLLSFFDVYGRTLGIKKVYGIDNYVFGRPQWVKNLENNDLFDLQTGDVTKYPLEFAKEANLIFHMASLASPVYYRLHPIETMDADVVGLRRLLDFYKEKSIKGFLFFSTSEIYGNPTTGNVPTTEAYWGNVNTCGPRACYDESKRFGETTCYNFAQLYKMPIVVVRPFNNFGPGMRVNDQRVVADFAKNIIENEDLVIYSDGKATRTFIYIPDAIIGYLKCILYGKFEIFNIGSDEKEITILELAQLYKQVGNTLTGYIGEIRYEKHQDKHYLTDNPQRRCPDITKAKQILDFSPEITVEDGIRRYLKFLLEESGKRK